MSRSTRPQSIDNDNCFPVESFTVEVDDAWHYLLIHRDAGRSIVDFKVMTRRVRFNALRRALSPTLAATLIFTVGAVLADGYRLNEVETFELSRAHVGWRRQARHHRSDGLDVQLTVRSGSTAPPRPRPRSLARWP